MIDKPSELAEKIARAVLDEIWVPHSVQDMEHDPPVVAQAIYDAGLADLEARLEAATEELGELKKYLDRCDLADFKHIRQLQSKNKKLARKLKAAERERDEARWKMKKIATLCHFNIAMLKPDPPSAEVALDEIHRLVTSEGEGDGWTRKTQDERR